MSSFSVLSSTINNLLSSKQQRVYNRTIVFKENVPGPCSDVVTDLYQSSTKRGYLINGVFVDVPQQIRRVNDKIHRGITATNKFWLYSSIIDRKQRIFNDRYYNNNPMLSLAAAISKLNSDLAKLGCRRSNKGNYIYVAVCRELNQTPRFYVSLFYNYILIKKLKIKTITLEKPNYIQAFKDMEKRYIKIVKQLTGNTISEENYGIIWKNNTECEIVKNIKEVLNGN